MSNIKKHITVPYVLNPQHYITVALVGVGGTGSQVLSSLARINAGLVGLGHIGIHVKVYDGDEISESNVGRQLYSPSDIGMNKAIVSVTRLNRFYGLDWEAIPENYKCEPANIIISCTDTVKSRLQIHKSFNHTNKHIDHNSKIYWLDLGNTKAMGQAILGCCHEGKRLSTVCDLFDLTQIDEREQGPSCSLAEALARQDLFINSTLANLGCNILWKLFTHGHLDYHGLFLNLETMDVRGIEIN